MNWIRDNKRSAWIIGLTLLVPLLLYLDALFSLLSLRQGYQADIDRLAPRVARMRGLIEHEEILSRSADKAEEILVDLVYPVTEDRTTVSASLQQDVRQMLVEAGLSISNSQVLPVREEAMFDYIGLKLTVNGSIDALDAGLSALNGHRPLLLVESIEIWPTRSSRRNKDEAPLQSLSASLQLLSLRVVQ